MEEEGNFAEELEQALENEPELGEIVKGRVLRIDAEGVIIDIGSKSEGIIPREEFLDVRGEFSTQVGDEVDVLLERRENREGLVVLSKRKVDKKRSWNIASAALANGTSLEGIVLSKDKGGFIVDIGGVRAFLPGSHMDIRTVKDPDTFLNQRLQFKVIKLNRERGNIMVSRRNFLIDELNQQRSQVISKLKPGRLVKGVVKNLTNYGAFIDLGGVDGLLHVNDMAWSKVTNPRQVVKTGEEIEVLVLSIDEASSKVALGLKQKSEDPWVNIAAKYPVESLIEAEVVSLTDFGAFLRIENGLEGLLPVSEMSWTKRLRHPREILKIGDSLRVKILSLDPQAKKITLGLRQTEPEPFVLFMENYKQGHTLDGEVKSITKYGAFVELVEGVTGLLHISDMSWDGSLKDPGELVKVGEQISVKILEIQADRKKISLGLKQLQENPWITAVKKYTVGTVVNAKVIRNTKFGVFVQMEPGVEGLIHITQLEKGKEHSEPKPLPEGEYVQAKIIKVNRKEHKIALSIREFMQDQEQAEMQKYLKPANKPGISLGEISGLSREELLKRFTEKPKNE